jgi:hypothetical protein
MFWYNECKEICTGQTSWDKVLSDRFIQNWIYHTLRGFVLDYPPSLVHQTPILVSFLSNYAHSDDIDVKKLYSGCRVIKAMDKLEELIPILALLKTKRQIAGVKTILELFGSTGEKFPRFYTIFLDFLQDEKWSALHSQIAKDITWNISWMINMSKQKSIPFEIVEVCCLSVANSKASDTDKLDLTHMVLKQMPKKLCLELVTRKIIKSLKMLDESMVCICETESTNYHISKKLHESHKCACFCSCSNCWYCLCPYQE